MTDLTNLTVDELLAGAIDMSLLPETYPRELMQIRGANLNELARRAQANDALRSAAQAIERTVLSKDGQVRAYNHRVVGVLWQVDDNGHQFMNKMPPVDVAAFRAALAAAPPPPSSGAPPPPHRHR